MSSEPSTIDALTERLDSLQQSFIQSQQNQIPLNDKSEEAYNTIPQVDQNTEDIATNAEDILITQEGVAESYEETNTSITQCEEAIAELYEMIIPE